MLTPENRRLGTQRANETRRKKLTLKQKAFVSEYLKSGSPKNSAIATFNVKGSNASQLAKRLLKLPKIQQEIEKALTDRGLTPDYAVGKLKGLIDAGDQNLSDTKPADVIKALGQYFKLIETRNKMESPQEKIKQRIHSIDIRELQKEIKELDKRQRRLLGLIPTIEEGEIEN